MKLFALVISALIILGASILHVFAETNKIDYVSSRSVKRASDWYFAGKDPSAKCTYSLRSNEYFSQCTNQSGSIDFRVYVDFSFYACREGTKPKICIGFKKATVQGPNGGFGGIGSSLAFSIKGNSGRQLISAPSGGSSDSTSHNIKPNGPLSLTPPAGDGPFTIVAIDSRGSRFEWKYSRGVDGSRTADRQTPRASRCQTELVRELRIYKSHHTRLEKFLRKTRDLLTLPAWSNLPEIQLCISGNVGEIKSVGGTRSLAGWMIWANSVLSIRDIPGVSSTSVNLATFLSNKAIQKIAARYDQKMTASEAVDLYQDYNRIKAGYSETQAIRSQSCVLYKLKSRMLKVSNKLRESRNRFRHIQATMSCSAAERARFGLNALEDTYWKSIKQATRLRAAAPLYTPDFTGCRESP